MVEFILKFRIQIKKKMWRKRDGKNICVQVETQKKIEVQNSFTFANFSQRAKVKQKKRVWFLLVFPSIYSQ
jgi:hypothetical protein